MNSIAPRDLYQIGPHQTPQVWLRRPGTTSTEGGAIFDVRSATGWSVRTLPPPAAAEPIYLSPPDPLVAVLSPNSIGVSASKGPWKTLSPWFLRTQPAIFQGFRGDDKGYDAWTDGRWFWATTSLVGGSVLRCDLTAAQ